MPFMPGSPEFLAEQLGNKRVKELQDRLDAQNQRPAYAQQFNALDSNNNLSEQYKVNAAKVGALKSNVGELDKRLSGIQLDKTGLNEIQNRALSKGPSAWAQMAGQQAETQAQQQRSQAGQAAGQAQADARSGLAMRGGLSSGSRERLAASGANNQMNAMQNIGAQAATAKQNIGLQDEQQKQQMLMQLPGMQLAALQPEMQKAGAWQQMAGQEQALGNQRDLANMSAENQANQFNMQNTMGAINQKNQQAMDKYKTDMSSWAAEQQARATEKSGQK